MGKEANEQLGRAFPEVRHQSGIRGEKEKPDVLERRTAIKADERQKESSKRHGGQPEDSHINYEI